MDVLELYKETGAYLEGHFLLASGRHAPKFLQSTTVTQYPKHTERFGTGIAELFEDIEPAFVIGPAMGGITLAHEVAKALGCRALFAEKDGQGGMFIREAFKVGEDETFIAVEDVVTTGGSLKKAMQAAVDAGGKCIGLASIIDRCQSEMPPGIPYRFLQQLAFDSFLPDDCPQCKAGAALEEV